MFRPTGYYCEQDYTVGPKPQPCCPCPPCPPPHRPYPHYHGKVSIIGKTVLSVKYTDCHGHVQQFDIQQNATYEIKAASQTRGIVTFNGRVTDFECAAGIEKLINAPHEINVTAIIVDYSDNYESKLIRVGVDNIVSMKPILVFDGPRPRVQEFTQPIPIVPAHPPAPPCEAICNPFDQV